MPNEKRQGPVQRWVHEAPGAGVDADVGEAFRALLHEEPFTDVELARVGRRLAGAPVRRSRPVLRVLPVVLAVLLGATGAAFAQWLQPGIWDVPSWFTVRPQPAPRDAVPARTAARHEVLVVAEAEPLPVTAPAEPAALARPAESSGSAPGSSGVALESELLQRALEKLRREHDGAGALRALDDYRARFPAGVLALEAAVARVDALLLLGRRSEALEQLARLPLARVGRRTELQLLRAELYAERNCRQAVPDFDAVLATSPGDALSERALYGRATCRLRLSDSARARADLEAYLARFPRGRFAPQIRAHLETND